MPHFRPHHEQEPSTGYRIVCGNCDYVFYYPTERCPRCGADPRWNDHRNRMYPHSGYDTQQEFQNGVPPNGLQGPPLGAKGARPDGFGYTMLKIGILICLSGIVFLTFFPKFLYGVILQIEPEIDPRYLDWIRWILVAFLGFGVFHGVFSMMSWRSGRYWYRNLRN